MLETYHPPPPPDPSVLILSPMYSQISPNHHRSPQNTFALPQPSIPVRSHLGTFFGALQEGDSITKGFYINTIALLTSLPQTYGSIASSRWLLLSL